MAKAAFHSAITSGEKCDQGVDKDSEGSQKQEDHSADAEGTFMTQRTTGAAHRFPSDAAGHESIPTQGQER